MRWNLLNQPALFGIILYNYTRAYILRVELLLFILLVLAANKLFAQDEKVVDFNKGLKLNINLIHDFSNNNYQVGNLAPVFILIDKRQNFHEIELNAFHITKGEETNPLSGSRVISKEKDMALRYQYSFGLLKNKLVIPYIGPSVLVEFQRGVTEPITSTTLKRTYTGITSRVSFITGIKYNISNRMFVDFSVPIDFFCYKFLHQRVFNPSLPKRQQRLPLNDAEFYLFRYLHLRLGMGMRF